MELENRQGDTQVSQQLIVMSFDVGGAGLEQSE